MSSGMFSADRPATWSDLNLAVERIHKLFREALDERPHPDRHYVSATPKPESYEAWLKNELEEV